MTNNQRKSMQYIIIISAIILVVLLWHYITPIETNEPEDVFPTETGYSVICYPDGKYGWMDSEGYRDIFIYDTHHEAYENMNNYVNTLLRQPITYPRDKYTTWEVCE